MSDHESYAIAKWIDKHGRVTLKGERILPFRKLRAILVEYGCEFEPPGSGHIVIRRHRQRKSSRFLKRRRTLRVRIPYRNEGSDVQKGQISKVRDALGLSHDDGVGSSDFYGKGANRIDLFIAEYRIILDHLAKL